MRKLTGWTPLFVAVLMFFVGGSARADLTGTNVTGQLYFNGGSTNYFDPAHGDVPAGYGNSSGTTATIGGGVEFGFNDTINLDTADFTGNALTVSDLCEYDLNSIQCSGNLPFQMIFTDPAFTGLSIAVGSDSFSGTTSASLVGDVLTLNVGAPTAFAYDTTQSEVIDFSGFTATPEPSSLLLLSSGLIGLGLMKRKVFQN